MPAPVETPSVVRMFLDDLRVERAASPHTLEAYARDLSLLFEFLARRGVREPEAARPKDLEAFQAELRLRGEAPRTVARRTGAVRSFFKYLVREGFLRGDPATLMSAPARARLLPRALGTDEARSLMETPRGDAPSDLRDRAALELLYGAGLRASELCGLRLRDVSLSTGVVRVLGKGAKERAARLGAPGVAALREWLDRGRPKLRKPASPDYVFLGDRGARWSRFRLHARVKRRAREAGVDPSTSAHTLRHTFATHLVRGGADLRAVQELLGHASVDTTQIYTGLGVEHLRRAHARAHPRA
ncbi:MAG TPA: tyrosine recombinase [Planctomycetota bacterium]|nr:tyrosine recombinase [Planctomycetota bacterium]